MSKRILLFDIDRTIFDTQKWIDITEKEIIKTLNFDINRKDISINFYLKSLVNDRKFNPEKYSEFLNKKFNIKMEVALNIVYGQSYGKFYSGSIYPETFEVIEKLKDKFTLGIYSEGTDKFQNHKFRSMGISKYFDKDLIFIVSAKDTLEVVSKLPKEAIVVDDKERICEFLTENNIKAIWLNKLDDRKSERFATIHNLLDLPNIL